MKPVFVILAALVAMVTPQDNAKMPEISEKAFIAKFQVIIINPDDSSKTRYFYAVEKYDETQNKASLMAQVNGVTVEIVMNYEDQTVTSVEYDSTTKHVTKCVVVTMAEALKPKNKLSDNFHYFGGFGGSATKTIPHMFSSKNMFSMNSTKPFKHMGLTEIDGIPADRWSTSMTWTDDKDNFNVDYYFTERDWRPAHSRAYERKRFPLRIEVSGTKTSTNKKIHHIYEYLDFVGYDYLSPVEFLPHSGHGCTPIGNIVQRKVPTIPDTISYGREIVDKNGKIQFNTVVYDKRVGLMKVENDTTVVLYDFNFGVRYETTGMHCKTRAIDSDLDNNAKIVDYFAQDIGPFELYMLNKTLGYIGQGLSRQIDTLTYAATDQSTIFDAYFAKMNWKFSTGFSSMPLSMDREGKHYNFFNFRATATSLRTDNLWGACRSWQRRKNVGFTFYVDAYMPEEVLTTDENMANLADAIAKQAMISSSQVQIYNWGSNYDMESKTLKLIATLYDPPSYEFLYRQKKGITLTSGKPKLATLAKNDSETIERQSAEKCEETAKTTNFACKSYNLCSNKDGSYTLQMYSDITNDAKFTTSLTCDHYVRSVDTKYGPVSLEGAIQMLQEAMEKGFLKISVESGWYKASVIGIAIETKTFRSDPSPEQSKFSFVANSILTKSDKIVVKSTNECRRQCLQRDYNLCKAVEYCYATQECFLSMDYPQKGSSEGKRSSCYISQRTFISEFQSLPGLTMLTKGNNVLLNIEDANICAQKCLTNNDFNCESFDYCKDSKECLLSKTHVYNVPADQVKSGAPTCTHYSKNYLLDFDMSKDTALSTDKKNVLQSITVSGPEQCAQFCRTGSGQTCVQFDYCSDKQSCQIATVKSKSLVAQIAKHNCNTYTLKDAKKVVANSKFTGSNKDTTYSDGSYGGLAFAMVLVGLAFGAGILFILHRKNILSRFVRY